MVIPVVVLAGGLVMAISDANIYSEDVDPGKAEDAEGGMPDAFSDPLFLSLTGLAILLIAALAYWQLRKKRAENRLKETMQAAQSAFRPHLLECLLDVRKIVETESDWEKVQPQVFDILQERLDGWNLRGIRGNSIAGRLASAMVDFAGLPERLAADVVDSLRLPHDDFPPQVKIEREEAANALTEAISLLRSLAKVAEPAA
jgi:Flp pilus assembly protein TadB